MLNKFTIQEIKQAMKIYCSECLHSCDRCFLKDFINFNLFELLKEVKNE